MHYALPSTLTIISFNSALIMENVFPNFHAADKRVIQKKVVEPFCDMLATKNARCCIFVSKTTYPHAIKMMDGLGRWANQFIENVG